MMHSPDWLYSYLCPNTWIPTGCSIWFDRSWMWIVWPM